MRVTNTTSHHFDFETGRKDERGNVVMLNLPAGETRDLELPAGHPRLVAGVAIGALVVTDVAVGKAVQAAATASAQTAGLGKLPEQAKA